MRVVERLAKRESTWRELDDLLLTLEDLKWKPADASKVLRLGELYRSVCTDLMLAESYDLPAETVGYLHALVGRAHNAVYRVQGFKFKDLAEAVLMTAPRQLRNDPALRFALLIFYGLFLLFALLAAGRPEFANKVVGEAQLEQMEHMYEIPITDRSANSQDSQRNDSMMAGFYILNNTTIGLRCFAWGIFLGIGSVFVMASNAITLGTVFGHMATVPQAENFYTFVTAHGPFELTAVVFSGAAGLRMGWGLVVTKGQSRLGSLRREAQAAMPTVGAAVVLFFLAAFIEGFISASPIPYSIKFSIALFSTTALLAYLLLGGRQQAISIGEEDA